MKIKNMVLQDEGPLIPKTEADRDFEEFADDVQKEREKKLDALAEFGEDGITPRQIIIGVAVFILAAVIVGVIGWAINEYVVT